MQNIAKGVGLLRFYMSIQVKTFEIALGSKTLDTIYRTKNQNILQTVAQRCSIKKEFWNILKYSKENICDWFLF